MTGKVYITGAGCGKADMMSLRALRTLEKAEVVVYDRILGDGVQDLIPKTAEMINAGKTSGNHTIPQDEINKILLEKAKSGKTVVRLKGGDPFLFGRGGEEAEYLYENNIDFEIIPGISAAFAVPELAGIPVTHRNFSSAVHILTGHFKDDKEIDFSSLVKSGGTCVFLMGLKNAEKIQNGFLTAGLDPNTPCAVIENGGTAEERIGIGILSELSALAAGFSSPSIIVIGQVCALHKKLYSKKPLSGRHIIIARPFERAAKLKKRLETEGARVSIVPSILIKPFDISADTLVSGIKSHKYIVFTSRTGVAFVMKKLLSDKYDSRIFRDKLIAAVGSGTAEELRKYGILADIMPDRFYTDELAKTLVEKKADNILLLRAENGLKEMDKILSKNNISFDTQYIYTTEKADIQTLPESFDTVVFASPSEAEFFETDKTDLVAVCIGSRTLEAAQKRGFKCITADTQTEDGLFECIMREVKK